uniref:Uncharacterized protein n=1 Tax=Physcomitrium patens TaxID=3218 RepID=A0A2K1IXQ0_PHYPA|nr:hypothetical protein PHYPA_023870 [Physcomitrium patens]
MTESPIKERAVVNIGRGGGGHHSLRAAGQCPNESTQGLERSISVEVQQESNARESQQALILTPPSSIGRTCDVVADDRHNILMSDKELMPPPTLPRRDSIAGMILDQLVANCPDINLNGDATQSQSFPSASQGESSSGFCQESAPVLKGAQEKALAPPPLGHLLFLSKRNLIETNGGFLTPQPWKFTEFQLSRRQDINEIARRHRVSILQGRRTPTKGGPAASPHHRKDKLALGGKLISNKGKRISHSFKAALSIEESFKSINGVRFTRDDEKKDSARVLAWLDWCYVFLQVGAGPSPVTDYHIRGDCVLADNLPVQCSIPLQAARQRPSTIKMTAAFLYNEEVRMQIEQIWASHPNLGFTGKLRRVVKFYMRFYVRKAKEYNHKDTELRQTLARLIAALHGDPHDPGI